MDWGCRSAVCSNLLKPEEGSQHGRRRRRLDGKSGCEQWYVRTCVRGFGWFGVCSLSLSYAIVGSVVGSVVAHVAFVVIAVAFVVIAVDVGLSLSFFLSLSHKHKHARVVVYILVFLYDKILYYKIQIRYYT